MIAWIRWVYVIVIFHFTVLSNGMLYFNTRRLPSITSSQIFRGHLPFPLVIPLQSPTKFFTELSLYILSTCTNHLSTPLYAVSFAYQLQTILTRQNTFLFQCHITHTQSFSFLSSFSNSSSSTVYLTAIENNTYNNFTTYQFTIYFEKS